MKTNFILAVFFALLALGCKKENEEPIQDFSSQDFGTVSCQFDEEEFWNGLAEPIRFSNDVDAKHRVEFFKTTALVNFDFWGFPLIIGKYPVSSDYTQTGSETVVSHLFREFGDAIEPLGDIIALDGFENYFEITNINWIRNELEGKF